MIVDNFYDDPVSIVKLLDNDYPITGCGTGSRSVGLNQINQNLFDAFCNGIYRLHNISPSPRLKMTSFFMEHTYNDVEIFNYGWVHIDGKNPDACRITTDDYNLILCGIVHLTPNPDPDTGTSLYRLKPNTNLSRQEILDRYVNNYTTPKDDYNSGKISLEEYEMIHKEYHSDFDLIKKIENQFNRMVSWDGGTLHAQNITKKMPRRLNQYFFVQWI